MSTTFRRGLGFALFLTGMCNLAAGTPIWKEMLVPSEISTSVAKDSIPYADGWAPTKKAYDYGLAWVGVFVGTPDTEWFGLRSESETKNGRNTVIEWNLALAPNGKPVSIVCGYHYTQAELRLQVTKTASRVRVTCDNSNVINGHPNVLRVEYQ